MAPAHPTAGHSPLSRSKRSLDLARPEVLAAVGADQIAYYRARSPWYDDLYECKGDYDGSPEQNAEWRSDLASVENALAAVPLHGNCVELGAGTGYWTERIIDRVDGIWALDASSEVLEIAQSRLRASCRQGPPPGRRPVEMGADSGLGLGRGVLLLGTCP